MPDATDKSTGTHAVGLDGFVVDRDADVAISVQLAWALSSRIDDGRFEPGQRLPALRDLAEATGVNVNTVRAVYQRLEARGLIESLHGSGTFVARAAIDRSTVGKIAADAARQASETGVDPREVAAALYVSSGAGVADSPDSERSGALRRRLLRNQITSLQQALALIEVENPEAIPVQSAARSSVGPALLSAEELERVRAQLVHRLASVQTAVEQKRARGPRATSTAARQAAKPRPERAAAAPKQRAASTKPRRAAPTRPAPAGT